MKKRTRFSRKEYTKNWGGNYNKETDEKLIKITFWIFENKQENDTRSLSKIFSEVAGAYNPTTKTNQTPKRYARGRIKEYQLIHNLNTKINKPAINEDLVIRHDDNQIGIKESFSRK